MRNLPKEPPSSEITPEHLYVSRREFIKNSALTLGTASVVGGSLLWLVGKSPPPDQADVPAAAAASIDDDTASVFDNIITSSKYDTDEPMTSQRDVTTYNNFYEFG